LLVVREGRALRGRGQRLDGGRDRVLQPLRVGERLPERRRGRRRDQRAGRSLRGRLRLRVRVVGRVIVGERRVLRRELLQRGLVLRAQRPVALEGADALRGAVLALERGGEVAPRLRVARVLHGLLLQARDRRAVA